LDHQGLIETFKIVAMNLILAIFLYLGIATSSETVITDQDIANHQIEIEAAKSDPEFYEFLEDNFITPGILVVDPEANN
jgi:hypothetical protein